MQSNKKSNKDNEGKNTISENFHRIKDWNCYDRKIMKIERNKAEERGEMSEKKNHDGKSYCV